MQVGTTNTEFAMNGGADLWPANNSGKPREKPPLHSGWLRMRCELQSFAGDGVSREEDKANRQRWLMQWQVLGDGVAKGDARVAEKSTFTVMEAMPKVREFTLSLPVLVFGVGHPNTVGVNTQVSIGSTPNPKVAKALQQRWRGGRCRVDRGGRIGRHWIPEV